jgi:hypothetical protein
MLAAKTMDTSNETSDQNTVSVTIRMDAAIHKAVKQVADSEDRSLTKQIERLIKTNPQIAELLETETTAGVSA